MTAARQRNDVADYKAELVKRAAEFGLDAAAIQGMEAPILVRVVDSLSSDAPRSELIAAVRRYNEGLTQQLSPRARAVAEARTLTPATLEALGELLAGAGDASLRDVLRESPRAVLEILTRDGIVTPQNRAQWVQGNGLSDEAKDRIEGMFLGRVVGTGDRLQAAALSTLAKLERATPYLVRVAGINPELDEIPHVQSALDLLQDAQAHGMTVGEITRQLTIGAPAADRDPVVVRIAAMLESLGQRAVGDRFKAWANLAARDPRQVTMFGKPPTREEAEEVLLQGVRAPNPRFAGDYVRVTENYGRGLAERLVRALRGQYGKDLPASFQLWLEGSNGIPWATIRRDSDDEALHVRTSRATGAAGYRFDKRLSEQVEELLRERNPKGKGDKLPKPTEATKAMALALVGKWRAIKQHQAPNLRRLQELERVVARQGKEHTAQAFKLAHGIAKRLGIEAS